MEDEKLRITIICHCGRTMYPRDIEFQGKGGITAIFDCEQGHESIRATRWFND